MSSDRRGELQVRWISTRIRIHRTAGQVWLMVLMALFGSQWGMIQAAGTKTLYFSSVGAARFDGGSFRTLFHLSNEEAEARTGRLQWFASAGGGMNLEVVPTWTGSQGTLQASPGAAAFSIPPKSSLELRSVIPGSALPSLVGWARADLDAGLEARAYLQLARREPSGQFPDFESFVDREVEVFPTTGLKTFAFPLFIYAGVGDIRTAFSVVNLSAAPGRATFTLRPGVTRTLVLRPGEMVADYFEQFWQVAFPAIFPLRASSAAEIESEVPLAVTVLRTAGPLPLSGVPVVPRSSSGTNVGAVLGREFTLAPGESGLIASENLRVTFWDVLEDNRCPIDAICIQAGRAVVALRVALQNQAQEEVRLSTEPNGNTIRVGNFTVTLVRVEPSRQSDRVPQIADYRAVLVVR